MVTFVIAKYKENIEWTKKINNKIIIYDKSDSPIDGSIKLKNCGKEGETFLYHIVNNYNNLDDVTVFLQANPFEHLQSLVGWRAELTTKEIDKVIEKMNLEINDKSEFSSFYQVLYNNPPRVNGANVQLDCLNYLGEVHNFFTLSPGAQYIVPKKYILSRPIDFWKKLHNGLYSNSLNGYSMENLWYLCFKHNMNRNVGTHDIEKHRCLTTPPSLEFTPYSYFLKHNISI